MLKGKVVTVMTALKYPEGLAHIEAVVRQSRIAAAAAGWLLSNVGGP